MTNADDVAQARAYIMEKLRFMPRMVAAMVEGQPELGKLFADFYTSVWGDSALPCKTKEMMFVAVGVSHRSPACLIHVIPAIERGATDAELVEAVIVGALAGGFVPNGPGMPYAVEYAAKVLEVARKYRAGEPWEYVQPAEFKM